MNLKAFENNAVALELLNLMTSGEAAGSIKRLENLCTEEVKRSAEWRAFIGAISDLRVLLMGMPKVVRDLDT